MRISKYHGCGNDFILALYKDVLHMDIEDFVINVCDRHTGIGADGCILVKTSPLEMIFYNCDGSRAPMCGNGIRCFAKYCIDEGIVDTDFFHVDTLAGRKQIQCIAKDPFFAKVAMGKPDYHPYRIHVNSIEPIFRYPLFIQGTTYYIYSLFMSTIHTVLFVDDIFANEYEELGNVICHHPMFKEKTNVNFVQIVDRKTLRIQTYERGVGMTLACGTGACASALTAYKENHCDDDVHVILAKGTLRIEIDKQENVYMSGPAVRTLKGEYVYV